MPLFPWCPAWLWIFFPTLWTSFSETACPILCVQVPRKNRIRKYGLRLEVTSPFLALTEQVTPPQCSVYHLLASYTEVPVLFLLLKREAPERKGLTRSAVSHLWAYPWTSIWKRPFIFTCNTDVQMCMYFWVCAHRRGDCWQMLWG